MMLSIKSARGAYDNDDDHTCFHYLSKVAEESGADVHGLASAADLKQFIEHVAECALGTRVDASILEGPLAILEARGCELHTLFAYGLILSGSLAPVVGPTLAARVEAWVMRFVGLPVPERDVPIHDLVR